MRYGRIGHALCIAAALVSTASCACAEVTEEQVRQAWKDVVRVAEMDELPLIIENTTVLNAWVTNGKTVTVTTELMKTLGDENEMFGVLCHEAGHAKLGHHGRTVATNVGISLAGNALNDALGGGALGGAAVEQGEKLAKAGFSREQEVEADDFAVDMAFKAGKSPQGIYNSLERFVIARGAALEPSGYLDHPPDERRLKHVEDRIHKHDPAFEVNKLLK